MPVITPRFFSPTPIRHAEQMVLDGNIYQHWCKVLRAKIGDVGVLFDGTGGEWQVKLTHIDKKIAQVAVIGYNPTNRTLPYQVTLGLVISRGERMDYAIQKATEMGVTTIQLLTSERGQETLKYEREQKNLPTGKKSPSVAVSNVDLTLSPIFYPRLP